MKKIVKCIINDALPIRIGRSAYVMTIDHPNLCNAVDGSSIAITSNVIAINEDGSFETHNSIYRPVQQLNG